jgi:hypothetical protein
MNLRAAPVVKTKKNWSEAMSAQTEQMGVKLAKALLLHYGEVSFDIIKALPIVESKEESDTIIRTILESYDVEVYSNKISTYPFSRWEKIIRLKEP